MDEFGYLDLHSHILPGVDDGAKDWGMTMEMLHMAYRQGVRHMVATPHNYPGYHKQDNRQMKNLVEEANRRAKQIAPDFQILSGNEILYRRGIAEEIEKGHILTLADSKYLLVEFLPGEQYDRIYQGLRELVEEGYIPVIAHMERIQALLNEEARVRELIELGSLIQVNCESLLGGVFDRRAARLRKFIGDGLVHFLGSDCHNLKERPPIMKDCVEKLCKKLPESCMNRILYENQKQFLQNKYL